MKNLNGILSSIKEPYDDVTYENLTVPDVPLQLKIKSLQNFIDAKIASTKDNLDYLKTSTLPDKDERIYLATNALNVYEQLWKIDISDELRFDFVEYVFNNGLLRTAREIDLKSSEIRQVRQSKIYESKEYKRHYHPFIVFILSLFLLPPIGVGLLTDFSRIFEDPLKTVFESAMIFCFGPMPFVFCGLAAGITMLYCKRHSSKFGVPIEPTVSCAVAGAALAGATAVYVSKKLDDRKQTVPKEV